MKILAHIRWEIQQFREEIPANHSFRNQVWDYYIHNTRVLLSSIFHPISEEQRRKNEEDLLRGD
jgi:hypothetical protein